MVANTLERALGGAANSRDWSRPPNPRTPTEWMQVSCHVPSIGHCRDSQDICKVGCDFGAKPLARALKNVGTMPPSSQDWSTQRGLDNDRVHDGPASVRKRII